MISIYGLTDPRDGRIRYVGKTCRTLKKRFGQHLRNSRKKRTHKERWIQSLVSKGLLPGLVLLEECEDRDWEAREIFWIAQYEGQLTNTARGGAGGHTPETAKVFSGERNKSAKLTEGQASEIKAKILLCKYSAIQIGQQYGISEKQGASIGREKYWKKVEPRISKAAYEKSKKSTYSRNSKQTRELSGLTLNAAIRVLEVVATGIMYKQAAKIIHAEFLVLVDTSTVCHIVKGRRWPDAIEGCDEYVRGIIDDIRSKSAGENRIRTAAARKAKNALRQL